MIERGRSSPPSQHQRVPLHNSGSAREPKESSPHEWGRSLGGGQDDGVYGNGSRSAYFGDEEEEGMIPQDEDDVVTRSR